MKWICGNCASDHDQQPNRCRVCGAASVWYQPTPDEIRCACLEIQAAWDASTEKSRHAVRSPRVQLTDGVCLLRPGRKVGAT